MENLFRPTKKNNNEFLMKLLLSGKDVFSKSYKNADDLELVFSFSMEAQSVTVTLL